MFKNPSFIFDIVCTVVWLGLLIYYYRKGFLAALVQLLGNLLSLVGAQRFASIGAQWVFKNFLFEHFSSKLAESLAASGGAIDLDAIAEKYAGFLPASLREAVVTSCERQVAAAVSEKSAAIADIIVANVIRPLMVPVIALALFFVGYGLLRMLMSMLGTVLGLVNRLPVLGTVNRWLGLSMGGLASLVDIYLVLCVVWGVIVITGGSLTVLNDTVMSSSIYYKMFNLFNPFLL